MTKGQILILIITLLAAFTTLVLNIRKIFKWFAKKFKDFFRKDKKRIAELENRISKLETKNSELERKTRITGEIPDGCELQHNNILLDKKTNIKYCWNCWNKINDRERRVLEGNEYSVLCRVCGIHTELKDPPNLPRYAVSE